MTEEEARDFCRQRCDAQALARLDQFAALLVEENQRQNLVSAASLAQVWARHLADSLQLLDFVPRETAGWLDLGTGAGFPGLAIALARPDLQLSLIESRKRRVEWLERLSAHFALPRCRVIGGRLENCPTFATEVVSARAFAPLAKLIKLSARFSTSATVWLLPKGRSTAIELAELAPATQAMFHTVPSRTDPTAAILIGQGRPQGV